MATLFIGGWDNANEVLCGAPIQETTVTVSGTSAQSAAVSGSNKEMRRVRLFSDTDCFVTWGSAPTALNNGAAGMPMGAENPEVIGIEAGHLIAVIERS